MRKYIIKEQREGSTKVETFSTAREALAVYFEALERYEKDPANYVLDGSYEAVIKREGKIFATIETYCE